jgi:hypothetical protein
MRVIRFTVPPLLSSEIWLYIVASESSFLFRDNYLGRLTTIIVAG